MTYYRPEWTVGRYYPQHKVAIMYNLMEGNSYFFEDDSASVIGEILSHQRNSAIDTQSLSKCYNIDDDIIQAFFDELSDERLLSKNAIDSAIVNNYRSRLLAQNESSKRNHIWTSNSDDESASSDAENNLNQAIKTDCICSATIELTYKCSACCIHCFNPKYHKEIDACYPELDVSDYQALIDELYDLGCYKVTLTGGDPFSKPILWDIIKYLYDKQIAFDIYTNGINLKQNIPELLQYYPKLVAISLYSGTADIHDTITRIPGSYNRTLSSIQDLYKNSIPLLLKCCIMRKNIDSYHQVSDIAKQYNAWVQYELTIIDSLDNGLKNDGNILPHDLLELVLRDKMIPIYVGPETLNSGKIGRDMNSNTCQAGTTGLSITPNGNVQPCIAFPLILGNLHKDSLQSILYGHKLKEWHKITLKEYTECGKHDYCNYCSICAGSNYVANSTPIKPCKTNCYIAKCRYDVAIKLSEGNDPLMGRDIQTRIKEVLSMNESMGCSASFL